MSFYTFIITDGTGAGKEKIIMQGKFFVDRGFGIMKMR